MSKKKLDVKKNYENFRKRKLISSFTTDTGFDVICCSCLQYKNVQTCKQIDLLSTNQQKKFLIKPCSLLKNRNDELYVCISCKTVPFHHSNV